GSEDGLPRALIRRARPAVGPVVVASHNIRHVIAVENVLVEPRRTTFRADSFRAPDSECGGQRDQSLRTPNPWLRRPSPSWDERSRLNAKCFRSRTKHRGFHPCFFLRRPEVPVGSPPHVEPARSAPSRPLLGKKTRRRKCRHRHCTGPTAVSVEC